MLPKSQDFHSAIIMRNPSERALLVFNNPSAESPAPSLSSVVMAWTSDDISATSGLRVVESINSGRELAIGQAVASTAQVSIFNDHGLLNDYTTQLNLHLESHIYLGVKISSATVPGDYGDANCVGFLNFADGDMGVPITGHSTEPYLRIGGQGISVGEGPYLNFPVHGLLIEQTETYAQIIVIGAEPGYYYGIRWSYGSTWDDLSSQTWETVGGSTWGALFGSAALNTPSESPFMYLHTFPNIARRNLSFMFDGTTVYESHADGSVDMWDYAPLGVFNFDTPAQRDQYIIPFTAYDRMTRFDRDVGNWLAGLTFPITLFGLLDALCAECGVPNAMQATDPAILNATLSITEKPDLGAHPSGRTLLLYIAEASGTNARMNRYGELELVAINDNVVYLVNPNPAYPGHHAAYDTQIASYDVAQIDKTSIDTPQEDSDPVTVSVGTGDNAYILSGNPLLQDTDTSVVETRITPIYNRLSALKAYAPTILKCTCDWSVQAGDCVRLWYIPAGQSSYAGAVDIPVFTQTITFNGNAVVVYENHGSPKRPDQSSASFGLNSGIVSEMAQLRKRLASSAPVSLRQTKSAQSQAQQSVACGYGVCDTANGTKKSISAKGVSQTAGTMLAVYFEHGNAASRPALSLNGGDALPLLDCYTGDYISATVVPPKMTALLLCTGDAWIILNPYR